MPPARFRLRSKAALKMRWLRSMSRQLPTRINTRVRIISRADISRNSPTTSRVSIVNVVILRLTRARS
ncbi:hypothetical protein D3C80_1748630 [compost metagenome]